MSHYYSIDIGGKTIELASVTSQIMELNKKGLLGEPMFFKGKDEALEIGSQVHALIDRINKGQMIPGSEWFALPEPIKNAVRGFIRFRDGFKINAKQSEFTVYSLKHGYAGTVDLIASIGHRIGLIDFKSGMMPEWYVDNQLALYSEAYKEMYPRRSISFLAQVNLSKITGFYFTRTLLPLDAHKIFQIFLELKKEAGLI